MPFADVAAEVNDMRLVHQQQPLQIDWLYRCVFVQFKSLTVRPFVNPFEDLTRLFVDENATGRPWI